MTSLREGDKGPRVMQLQLLLAAALKIKVRADGSFGARTAAALAEFQKRHHLATDGVAGPKTWEALGVKASALAAPAPSPTAGGCQWLAIAQAELGIHEIAGPTQHHKRILEYHTMTTLKATADETPWCSSFVNWVVAQAGLVGTKNALAKSWIGWGRALAQPQPGAITVIKRKGKASDVATGSSTGYHVAFYISGDTSKIRLLGGNQGDSVKYSNFVLSGYEAPVYRWPT